jgi:hypothetical protein
MKWRSVTSLVACSALAIVGLTAVNGTLAAAATNATWAWGYGALGDGSVGSTPTRDPVAVDVPGKVVAIIGAGSADFGRLGYALTDDGAVWNWHSGASRPTQVAGLSDITSIAASEYTLFALKADGTEWAWGANTLGSFGDGSSLESGGPVQVSGLSNVVAIADEAALLTDGSVWTWGPDPNGPLQSGSTRYRNVPARVSGLSSVTAISGYQARLALQGDGTVSQALVGGGRTVVSGLANVVQVASGLFAGALAVKDDGTVASWIPGSTSPTQVQGLTDAVQVVSGWSASYARRRDGTMWGWGSAGLGQLGPTRTGTYSSAVQILGLSNVTVIGTGLEAGFAVGDYTPLTPPPSSSPPGAPTAVSLTPGNATIKVSWTAPASIGGSPITDYVVEYRLHDQPTWTVYPHDPSVATELVMTGLTNGSRYDVRVTAINADGPGTPSAPATASPSNIASDPTGLTLVPGDNRLTASWQPPVYTSRPIVSYLVQYRVQGSSTWITWNHFPSTKTSITLTGLTNQTTFEVRVAALLLTLAGPVPGAPSLVATGVPRPNRYVALGDSFASGEGAAKDNFTPDTKFIDPATSTSVGCHRGEPSSSAWAYQVRDAAYRSKAVQDFQFVACSGAVSADLFAPNASWVGFGERLEPAQLDAVTKATELVTVSIGGNDVGFEAIIHNCLSFIHSPGGFGCSNPGAESYETAQAGLTLLREGRLSTPGRHGASQSSLSGIYQAIAQEMSDSGTIIVTGYPHLFSTSSGDYPRSLTTAGWNRTCQVGTANGIAPLLIKYEDAQWINSLSDQGNALIGQAVTQANTDLRTIGSHIKVYFVDVSTKQGFGNHGVCTSSAHVNGAQVTVGTPGNINPRRTSFHPNAKGQDDYWRAIQADGHVPSLS